MHSYQITAKSSNKKTGPMLVTTTSSDSCPPSCAFMGNGCYAEAGPLGMLWRKLSQTSPGDTFNNGKAKLTAKSFDELIVAIKRLPKGAIWRHNQAGDLPGKGLNIDVDQLRQITKANLKRRGYTYTHKPAIGKNLLAIREANASGFAVNISANSAKHAAQLHKQNPDLPIACVLPIEAETKRVIEQDGLKILVCPVTRKDTAGNELLPDLDCQTCGACANIKRAFAIGFPAHGTSKNKANAIAA